MRLYELEILEKKRKYKKYIRARNVGEVQSKVRFKKCEILNIKELSKESFKKLDNELFILFFKELALLCEVGMSIKDSLKELNAIHNHKIINRIWHNLESGQSLSIAFENANFGLTYAELALIKTCENTGKLSQIFMQISILRQKAVESELRLKKILRYPLIVFFSLFLGFVLLLFFLVPNFKLLFEDLNLELPLVTQNIINIYLFLENCILFLSLFFLVLILSIRFFYKKNHPFSYFCDSMLLKIPPISTFILYHQNYTFFMIFSLLLKSAISLSNAFDLAISTLHNKKISMHYQELKIFIDSGLEMSHAFKKVGIFDPLVLAMLSVAMKSSKLEFLSAEIAKYYENKSENLRDKFLLLLEPMMILFIAILVLFLALAFFLPIWELSSKAYF